MQVEAGRLISLFAQATGAEATFLAAPAILGSAEARNALMADPTVVDIRRSWSQLTTVLAGIGAIEPSLLLWQSGNAITDADKDLLRRQGAVGDVCLRFFDAAGHPTESGLDRRVMAIEREDLLGVPRRIGVAGGERKLKAIQGALAGSWINILVTDLSTAQVLAASRPISG